MADRPIFKNLYETIEKLCNTLEFVDISLVKDAILAAQENINSDNYDQILTQLARTCGDKTFVSSQWQLLGGKILVLSLYESAPPTFSEAMNALSSLLNPNYLKFCQDNADILNSMIVHERDFQMDIFAVSTVKASHLGKLRSNNKIFVLETPQYMYLRVATFLWYSQDSNCFLSIKKMYDSISQGHYSAASPTLFNAGFKRPQMASCFLSTIDDTMSSIAKSWKDAAVISQNSGGVGFDYSNLRHSEVGNSGIGKGIIPWLKIKNEILCGVDQGGKRKGSGTVFLRDWHLDIVEFVSARDDGVRDMTAPDLFYGLMISNLFMNRVIADEMWTLFCPNKARGLADTYGADFEKLYLFYETQNLSLARQIRARELFNHILQMQIKKGMPFMCYIDSINGKNNQKHDGLIRCLNLCVEIGENTGKNADGEEEIASCNLSADALNQCVRKISRDEYDSNKMYTLPKNLDKDEFQVFDFDILNSHVVEMVNNLNQVIDRNYYPSDVPEIQYANLRNRPIAIGVQGQADAVALLDMSWVSPNEHVRPEYADNWSEHLVTNQDNKRLNFWIYEALYYFAVRQSMELAKIHGHYTSFPGSELSQGKFHFDQFYKNSFERDDIYSRLTQDWKGLRKNVTKYGTRNCLFVALMPTASSAHVLGNNECFEPFNQLIFTRTVLAGQFILVNKHLNRDLEEIGLWNTDMVKTIILNKGSISNVDTTTFTESQKKRFSYLQLKYKTIFEIPQRILTELCADRGLFVDQSQSFNCHMADPTVQKLTAFHIDAWKKGLKTGMYYLRQPAATSAINFSLDTINIPPTENVYKINKKKRIVTCTETVCTSCLV